MRKLASSTPGVVSFAVHRQVGKITTRKKHAKFRAVREEANALIKQWNHKDNPVFKITSHYTFHTESGQ